MCRVTVSVKVHTFRKTRVATGVGYHLLLYYIVRYFGCVGKCCVMLHIYYLRYSDLYSNQKSRFACAGRGCPTCTLPPPMRIRSKNFPISLRSRTNRRPRSYFLILALVAKQLGRREEESMQRRKGSSAKQERGREGGPRPVFYFNCA